MSVILEAPTAANRGPKGLKHFSMRFYIDLHIGSTDLHDGS